MKFQLCFHVDTPLSDILSYHRDLAYHCSLLRPHLRFCRHHKSRKVTVGELVYFWLLQRHESVSKIDSLLTGEVIKFERFRRREEVVYLRIVSSAIRAHFLGFVRADSCPETFLSTLFLFFFLSLCVFLSRFVLPPQECVFSSFSFYHFYWTATAVVIEVDRGLWTRCYSVGRKCHDRSSSRRIATAGTLSRALASSIGIINYRQDCAGPVSLWIIGADAWHHKWLPKKRSNRVSVDVRIRCFKQNARAIYRRMFLLSVWSKKWNVLYFIHLDYITNSIKILSVVQLNEILSCDYRRWEEIRWSSKVTSFNFL